MTQFASHSTESAADVPAAASAAAGLGNLIDALESQLEQLRSTQHLQSEQALALHEQEAGLAVARQELEARLAELRERASGLDDRAAELEHEWATLRSAREHLATEEDAARLRMEEGHAALLLERRAVEVEREAIEAEGREIHAAQARLVEAETALADARRAHDETAAALEHDRAAIAEERSWIEAARTALERDEAALRARREALDADRAAVDSRHGELGRAQRDAADARAEIDRVRSQLEQRIEQVRAERARLQQDAATAAAREREQSAALQAARDELESLRTAGAAAAESHAESRAETETRIAVHLAEIDALRGETARLGAALAAAPSPDALAETARRLDAAIAERDRLRGRLEHAESRLAEQARNDRTGTLVKQVERLDEERQVLLRRVAVLETQLTETALRIDTRTDAHLADAKREIEVLRGIASRAEDLEHELARLEARALRAEAARDELAGRAASDDADRAAADEIAAQLRTLQARTDELESARARVEDEIALARQLRDEAEARAADAEHRATSAEQALAARPEPSPAPDATEMAQMKRRLAEVARHLKLRQVRLKRYRAVAEMRRSTARQERPRPAAVVAPTKDERMEAYAAEMRRIDVAKRELGDRTAEIAQRERRMVRRWATARAATVVGSFAVMAAVSAAVGWFGATMTSPPVVAASLELEAHAASGRPNADALATWSEWHQGLLQSPRFRMDVAGRMAQVKLDAYDDEVKVGNRIERDLAIDEPAPGRMVLTLAGTNGDDTTAFLDVLGTAIARESSQKVNERPGSVVAELVGERVEDGRYRYASLRSGTISDQRLPRAAVVAGASFGGLLLAWLGIGAHLRRVKKEFDDDGTMFGDASIADA